MYICIPVFKNERVAQEPVPGASPNKSGEIQEISRIHSNLSDDLPLHSDHTHTHTPVSLSFRGENPPEDGSFIAKARAPFSPLPSQGHRTQGHRGVCPRTRCSVRGAACSGQRPPRRRGPEKPVPTLSFRGRGSRKAWPGRIRLSFLSVARPWCPGLEFREIGKRRCSNRGV